MDETLYNDDLLIRYLDGELSENETTALEGRLKTDEVLRNELQQLRVAVEAVKQFGTVKTVAGIHAEMMKKRKAPTGGKLVSLSKNIRYALAVAASILVLFVGIKLYQASQASPDRLFNEAFVDFNASAARGSEDNASTIEKHYRNKDYRAVIADVRPINMTPKDSLLLGLSYLQTNRWPQAIGIFEKLASSSNDFQPDAEFYLSLSYLKSKNYKKALPLMQKIAGNNLHLYHEHLSTDILDEVQKLVEKN